MKCYNKRYRVLESEKMISKRLELVSFIAQGAVLLDRGDHMLICLSKLVEGANWRVPLPGEVVVGPTSLRSKMWKSRLKGENPSPV